MTALSTQPFSKHINLKRRLTAMPQLYLPFDFPSITKRCLRCGKDKSLDSFHKRTVSKDGLSGNCKDCASETARISNAKNKESIKQRSKNYAVKNRDKIKAKGQAYYLANKERIKLIASDWHAAHREESKEQQRRRYAAANKESRNSKLRQKWAENPEQGRARTQRYKLAHPEKTKEQKLRRRARELNATIGKVCLKTILKRDNYLCHICKQTVAKNELSYDHVIPLARGGGHSMENIKVAHFLCNLRKGTFLMSELKK